MITTCWSKEPRQRCELSVVHHILSTPSLQDALVEFPPVGRENLIRLAEELLYVFLALPLNPGERATLRTMQEYISNVLSRDGTPPMNLSPAKAAALTETLRQVYFPLQFFPQSLKFLAIRPRLSCCPTYGLPRSACGSGFAPTPFLNH
jgi:hypothetical protein